MTTKTENFAVHCVEYQGYVVYADGRLFKDGVMLGQYRSLNQARAAAEQLASRK